MPMEEKKRTCDQFAEWFDTMTGTAPAPAENIAEEAPGVMGYPVINDGGELPGHGGIVLSDSPQNEFAEWFNSIM